MGQHDRNGKYPRWCDWFNWTLIAKEYVNLEEQQLGLNTS